ncbi:hypothetical protein LguiB_033630 [Lonicera macranthoides]
MGRNLGPGLRRELENLDKDADSRKSAMKALKSYVKELDSKAIPLFLAQVSQTKETFSSSAEYTISLYEVLARVHGSKIVPQIDNIMGTIIKTLTSTADSFALHQACSKVVAAIARYGINPTTPIDKKRRIIHSLCKPLSESLLVSQENLSSGAALCLKGLVDSDNWRFASNEMVNEVCQRVAGAIDKPMQNWTNSLMALVMALTKHNSLIVEAYARLLIQSALRILNDGVNDGNSQKRLSAIQVVNLLMKCLDPKSVSSELELVIEEMEKRQSDQMAYVKGAAFEALQTAKRIAGENGSKFERDLGSISGSNFSMRENGRRRNLSCDDRSPLTSSPESQTVDSFVGFDSLIESPISSSYASRGLDNEQRSINRELWRMYENSGVDASLKDGVFSEVTRGSVVDNLENEDFSDNHEDYANGFAGFLQGSPRNVVRSTTPSPQRSRSHINVDNVKIFSSPRKLIRSLQENDANSNFSENQSPRFRSPTSKYDQNGLSNNRSYKLRREDNPSINDEQFHGSSESVSSTEDIPPKADLEMLPKVVLGSTSESQSIDVRKDFSKSNFSLFCGLFIVILAVIVCVFLIDVHQDEGYNLVPT